jgi:hypothetical protein
MASIPIIKTATHIVLNGGLVRMAEPTLKFLAVNIALKRSDAWLNGTLILNKMPFYRLVPSQDYQIEIKNIKNDYFLAVNEKVISQSTQIFGYTIHLDLNKAITDTPYADFFRYY